MENLLWEDGLKVMYGFRDMWIFRKKRSKVVDLKTGNLFPLFFMIGDDCLFLYFTFETRSRANIDCIFYKVVKAPLQSYITRQQPCGIS